MSKAGISICIYSYYISPRALPANKYMAENYLGSSGWAQSVFHIGDEEFLIANKEGLIENQAFLTTVKISPLLNKTPLMLDRNYQILERNYPVLVRNYQVLDKNSLIWNNKYQMVNDAVLP